MIRTQIQLTEEQASVLKTLASEQRISVAELIRQSVDRFVRLPRVDMDARRRRAIAAAGRFHSGRADIAVEHDRYLAEAYEPQ